MAFIAGVQNPKRILTENDVLVAEATAVDNEEQATGVDADEQEVANDSEAVVQADVVTQDVVTEAQEADTASEMPSAGVSATEAVTPIQRGRKPSKKA